MYLYQMNSFELDYEKYELIHSELEDPGLHLVRIPMNPDSDLNYPLDRGEAGVLFTGHSEIDPEVLQSSGVFFSIPRSMDVVRKGARGDSFEPISGFNEKEATCVWCNEQVDMKDHAIKFQNEEVHNLFNDQTPTFHSSCFLEFRYHLKELMEHPEVVSHTV